MLTPTSIHWPGEPCILQPGTALMRRAERAAHVIHIERGRVALGIAENGALTHQLGMIEGPCWLDATCAVLGLAPLVDAIADSEVKLRRMPLADFEAGVRALPEAARSVLRDVARAHRQQTELAVSRLAKDAEARCAEWLLRHAEPAQDAPGTLAVMPAQAHDRRATGHRARNPVARAAPPARTQPDQRLGPRAEPAGSERAAGAGRRLSWSGALPREPVMPRIASIYSPPYRPPAPGRRALDTHTPPFLDH